MINFIAKYYRLSLFKISSIFAKSVEKKFIKLPANKLNLIIKIRLSHIKFFLPNKYIYSRKYYIWNGNWFKKKISIRYYKNYNLNYNSVFQIFTKKINFKKSDEYKLKLNHIKKFGVTARGHKSINELNLYFKGLSQLHKNMKMNGYKSQKQLNNNKIGDEIGVFLGPSGEIIKAEDKFRGTHRFALSKILNIKYVYINVRAVDFNFLKKNVFKNMAITDNEVTMIKKIKLFLKIYQ